MNTWSPEAIARAKANIADWSREAHESQLLADALREHADEHQRRAYMAEDHVRRIRALLAEQGVPDEEEGT